MPYVNFAGLTTALQAWDGCTLLADFAAGCFDNSNCAIFTNTFRGCALTTASIENILASIDTSGVSSGTLTLSGGTNASKATWTAGALAAETSLVGKSWTIYSNP